MLISVCIVAYNESATIRKLFEDILEQDYEHQKIEIVLIDSMSVDDTRNEMEEFAKQYAGEFYQIQVLSNPGKILPCGWNVALQNFSGEAIVRIDAHASIAKDFVRLCVEDLENEMICGGFRPNIIDGETPWKRLLLMAESSMFGSSIASYRRNAEPSYVKSIFHGAYRREVFKKTGGYHEYLARTEDNEMHYRMQKNGFRIYFDPRIQSYQHTRPGLRKMCRQKYLNGYWIGLTSGICPACLSVFHFVPGCFVGGILLTTVLAIFSAFWPAWLMWGLYALAAVAMSFLAVKGEKKHPFQLLLPFLFLALHISYGVGTLIGILKMPFYRRGHRECPAVEEVRSRICQEG